MFDGFVPPFVKQYAQLGDVILNAARDYADDVRHGIYPQATGARRDSVPLLISK
jgi:ketopantoate hydroxymethyltransferase